MRRFAKQRGKRRSDERSAIGSLSRFHGCDFSDLNAKTSSRVENRELVFPLVALSDFNFPSSFLSLHLTLLFSIKMDETASVTMGEPSHASVTLHMKEDSPEPFVSLSSLSCPLLY